MRILKVLFFAALFLTACSDPCADITCNNHGTCLEGDCNCDPGYSGPNCETNICDSINCNNGDCDMVTGACNCDEGYEGNLCDTEIRAKFLGTYTGDFQACLDGFGGIDIGMLPAGVTNLTAISSPDPNDINKIILSAPNPIIMIDDLVVEPTNGQFIIPVNNFTIDNENIPIPITITITGFGEFVNDSQLNVSMTIIIPLLGNIECVVEMMKN